MSEITFEELAEIFRRLSIFTETMLTFIAEKLYNYVYSNVPVRTGMLRASIRYDYTGSRAWITMGDDRAYYAPYVEFGTRPHMIYPRRAMALRFEVDGETVFAKYVRHPGTRPQHVMVSALEMLDRELEEVIEKVAEILFP